MLTLGEILKQYWGYKAFRPLQEEIIAEIIGGRDTLALLPTGGGKSLCYQVPALAIPGFCLVVSPLIALMQDQVTRLQSLGIPAACIHAGLRYHEVKTILEEARQGSYKLLYVSPERLQTDLFEEFLPYFRLSFIAVDEAHCISQWGHDFRPDYLKIARLRKVFSAIPVLALTASATPEVQADILLQLGMNTAKAFRQSFERANIFYDIRYTENKNKDLEEALSACTGSSIVYCRSRRQTETLARYLDRHGIPALFYHAGMKKEKRAAAQQAWMSNEVRTMIATTAFGMGIDKPDVGAVIHYDAPEHLEAYYQEAGRAGRNGAPATALLLFNITDTNRLRDSTAIQYPEEEYLRRVYQAVAEYLQIAIGTEPHRYYPFELNDFCKKFGFDALPTSAALKLLEREGLWTLSDTVFHPATIYFTASRQDLDELAVTHPDLGYIATRLLRLYGTLFAYPTVVSIKNIAAQLRLRQDHTEQLIIALRQAGILEYNKPSEAPQMFFHHYRVDSRHLLINMRRIAELKERHEKRTDAMLGFLQDTTACRTRAMLAYFGEDTKKDCEHCDLCVAKRDAGDLTDEHLLRADIIKCLKTVGSTHVNPLLQGMPPAIRTKAMALIRTMADEGSIKLHPDGRISAT